LLNENQRKQIREFVISLLSDPSVEVRLSVRNPTKCLAQPEQPYHESSQVRELASVCLSSLLHGEESSVVEALAPRFLSALGRLVRRRDAKGESGMYLPDFWSAMTHSLGINMQLLKKDRGTAQRWALLL